MGKVHDAALDLLEQVSPATPAAGLLRFYAKSDHKPYIKDSTGLETAVISAGGGAAPTFVSMAKWGTD